MSLTAYGPGDAATWPAYAGHPNDPRHDDAGESAAEDARDEAITCVIATPSTIAEWLGDHCGQADDVVPTHRIGEEKIVDAPVSVLLALLLDGTDAQALAARFELRERMVADYQQYIDGRTHDLLARRQEY